MPELDPAENFMLRMINSFTAEDIRNVIMHNVNLAEIVQDQYQDYLGPFKDMVRVYDATHPKKIQSGTGDFTASAKKMLAWLKVKRPDLGYEIEAYVAYPTTTSIGLVAQGASQAIAPETTEHVGLAWLATQLESFATLLL